MNSWDLPSIKKTPTYSSLFFLSFSLISFLAQIPAKWCQNNTSMYLMISFIFVEDGRKGSELGFRNNNRENREVESLLQGIGASLHLQLQDSGGCFRM